MRIEKRGVLTSYTDDPDVTRLEIPKGVKRIAPHAFYGAEYLEEIIIPEGVRQIDSHAFEGCRELRRVTMPDSVKAMGRDVFTDCRQLADVRLSAGLTEIPSGAFDCCHSLLSVYIPDGVEYIGARAFNSCVSLKEVRLPDTLTEIEHGAFMETFSLKSISLPEGIEDIPSWTFYRSGVDRVNYRGMDIRWEPDEASMLTTDFCFTKEFSEQLKKGDFTAKGIPFELKEPFIIAHFAKTRDPAAADYIKKHFGKIFGAVIRTNNIAAAEAFIQQGCFLSTRNIARYINIALEHERHEIYLMLVTHKETLGGGSTAPASRFRL